MGEVEHVYKSQRSQASKGDRNVREGQPRSTGHREDGEDEIPWRRGFSQSREVSPFSPEMQGRWVKGGREREAHHTWWLFPPQSRCK